MINMDCLHLISFALALSYVSGASLNAICKVPADLHKKLVQELNGNAFLSLNVHPQQPLHLTENNGLKSCPNRLPTEGTIKERSTCPWYNKPFYKAELYPSNWTEAVCHCEKCFGFDGKYHCEPVISPAMFLKRSKCVGGFYMYEAYTKQIKTGCVCTLRSDKVKPSKR